MLRGSKKNPCPNKILPPPLSTPLPPLKASFLVNSLAIVKKNGDTNISWTRGIQFWPFRSCVTPCGDSRTIGSQNEFFTRPHTPFSPPSKSSFLVSSWAIVKKIGGTNISWTRRIQFRPFRSCVMPCGDGRTNWSRNDFFYSSLPPLTSLQSNCSRWVLGRKSKKLVVQISPEREELKFGTSGVVWRLEETVKRSKHENERIF